MSALQETRQKCVCRLIYAVALVATVGCDKSPPTTRPSQGANDRAYWLRYLERSIATGVYRGVKEERARLLAEDLRRGNTAMMARLLSAELSGGTSGAWLTVHFYDETGSIAAVRIREERPDGTSLLIEDYEVCPGGRGDAAFLDSMLLPCKIRSAGQRKDPQAWTEYVARNVRDRSLLPAIYVTEPSDSVRVLISLMSVSGTESNRVSLSD